MITETKLTMAEVLSPVRDGLKAVEDRLSEYGPDQHEALTAATNHLLASGGKRIRPAMSLLAAAVFDADPDQAVYVAASIEMLHTATLVHDDLIDGSLLRRGIPTLNANWTPGATVLTGDHLFARAADLAAHADSVRVMRIFARTLMVLVNGEINQMFKSKGIASRDDYYRRIYAKTASVFEAAAEAGAVAAHAAEDDIAALATYGREVGSAFQIVDDKALLNGRMGDVVITARVVEAVRASNAIRASLAEARQFVARGLSALDSLPPGQPVESLRRLAEYVVSRDL
ncbi:MAG: polyprenyl synthetase family protein [Chloroflexi bacterium]|nr:polyprenyl synthetase family protein [Chloroflexota bacterium]